MLYNVSIVNGRLVVDEDGIKYACTILEQIVLNKLRQLGHKDVDVKAYFDDECFNENTFHFWKEINIVLSMDDNTIGSITYTTDSYEPSLVYTGNKFKFYYVFEQSSYTCTNPIDLKNTSKSEYECKDNMYLERILIEELEDRLKQDILYLVDGLMGLD